MRTATLVSILTLLLTLTAGTGKATADEVVIGTGSTSGVYYRLGRAICRLVDRYADGLTCDPLPTAGSVFNLDNVRGGALEFGIVQSDVQYNALNRSGAFQFVDLNYANVRALFSAHPEPFTVLARRDAEIRTLDDLKGRRVNIGNPGSGQRATMESVMAAKGWSKKDFSLAEELPASQQSLALCHERVHAIVYTVGHPNESVKKAMDICDAQLVPVSGPAIDELLANNPYFVATRIPGGLYAGNPRDVPTFGVTATLVSSTEVPADTVYKVMTAVFDHLDELRRMHPAFAQLQGPAMSRDGLTAPAHDGALNYFVEKGLR